MYNPALRFVLSCDWLSLQSYPIVSMFVANSTQTTSDARHQTGAAAEQNTCTGRRHVERRANLHRSGSSARRSDVEGRLCTVEHRATLGWSTLLEASLAARCSPSAVAEFTHCSGYWFSTVWHTSKCIGALPDHYQHWTPCRPVDRDERRTRDEPPFHA